MALLEVENLQTHFRTPEGINRAVDGVSFHVNEGETLAIVGESGCGKSVTAMSLMRLIPEPPGKIAGSVRFQGTDLLQLSEREMRAIRGNDISMIFQAQILQLMLDLKRRVGAAIILITHDLGVVAEIAERVMVMYAGRKVEEAPVAELFRSPRHPYTQGLLGAVPKLGSSLTGAARRLVEIPGQVPSLKQRTPGCVFAGRCPLATDLCL